MDKEIALEVTTQKRRKAVLIVMIVISGLVLAVWILRGFIKSSINRSQITASAVQVGNIENTINATGEVLPEFEEIITSPINASIKNALMDAGNKVNVGQSVITLDKTATQTEYDKLNFQLESKRNEISKLKLDLGKSFYDIKSNNDIKQLHISNLADAVENAKRLYKAGGGTRENIEQAELNLKVAQLEKKQLENEIKNKQQTMRIEIKEAEIAAAIQQSDLSALQRKLNLANIVATRKGVITYVNKNIGANIHEGETLARIADLGSFKVQGSISDNSVDQLHAGIPVIVRVNDNQLRGHVTNVSPSIQNSIISFDIQLDDRSSKLLRPNMKVDVFLVTAAHSKVMQVANGPAFKGSSLQDIFVINGSKAERRTVHIGLSNFDFVEIKGGVKPGDVVITSDMSEYKNSKEVTIN
ncbi:efflux RND transporter periplasmic adaptor subunit [Mucilaginibacter sp. SG564]|uniref:efflux RND transporter periplasmic adaptor subunit n=1 Tax=unclassified Mucilaginibacter TaxID=2617802 RepID=UPI001551BD69|nr:HlyD family efflux transporter periplasmic adaptor subunit [Mucilaginibacter sp. SG564]NOW97533.1 HlyD family secretion protein [Mucilaginibacter sp. SG564]